MRSRNALAVLSLSLLALLVPVPAVVAATDGVAASSPPGTVGPPPSDTHHDASKEPDHGIENLDSVVVTASPLRDTAAALSKPVDVLAGALLDESRGASLGETIAAIPGVQSSNFGPGVGRPILRGLDGPRVAVLSGGLSSQDVSTVSQDHSPAIEPFLADQIEVLKGPSTLLYGTGAIGGVVNAVDGRIPEKPVDGGFSGRAEARFAGGDQDGSTDMVRVDGGNDHFALHADAVYRNAGDYATPEGRQANSFIDTKAGSVGGSLLGDWGFIGLSGSRFEDGYGNPGEPGDLGEGERGVHLQMRQNRYEMKGGLTNLWGEGNGVRFSFGHTDYKHVELEGAEPGTTFTKDANEGRVEASFAGDNGWQGAVGLQGSDSTFTAEGEEAFVPETTTRALGVFGVARKSWDALQLDLGARVDQVKSDPAGADSRSFKPVSLSLAGGWKLDEHWRITANLDRAERAPVEEELFSDGPHIATLAYEIGNADLRKEAANQIEVGMQYRGRFVDAKVSAYYNRFSNFIYLIDTGENWYWDEGDENLPIRRWSQSDAAFRGVEGEATFHLVAGETGHWDLRTFGDTVRATLAHGGGNVPRIAPSRLGAQMRWERDAWQASLGVTRYARQDRVAVNETPTDGYTMVDAHATYHVDNDRFGWELFLNASNLTDQVARVHTSFLKDRVRLPGRSFDVGVRVFF